MKPIEPPQEPLSPLLEAAAALLAGAGGSAGQYTPLELLLALQQLGDDDPWLEEPISTRERAGIDAADEGEVESW